MESSRTFPILFLCIWSAAIATIINGETLGLSIEGSPFIGIGIGIGIGGGGGGGGDVNPPPSPLLCQPPEAPPPPPRRPKELGPSDFSDYKLYVAYRTIQRFKTTITSDPKGITNSWTGPDVCNKYQGFACDNPPYNKSALTLSTVDFNGFNLGADSIEMLVELEDLAFVHANSNRFRGTVPDSFSKLTLLYQLDFSNNLLSGGFPPVLTRMKGLEFLDLRFNDFSGSIPPGIFELLRLGVIFINNNRFEQSLPANLGHASAALLTFANNAFCGPIPSSFCELSETLREVLFLNNRFSGCLPYEVGKLKETLVFDVSKNMLSGELPESLGCMAKLELLNLADNYFGGSLPESVCVLGQLMNLTVSGNYLRSLGPACRQLARKGKLDDRLNCITGRPNQRPAADCAAFYSKPRPPCRYPSYLICSHRRLHEQLPPTIAITASTLHRGMVWN
ncbi:uncharacterized protein At4g06744 [Amborella trichopoda]|uniref:Leucine-rich repeat-containing N-terminal plant-type domain-containing protein n=1 Tax=Amborella trichopoda TaxID=13333 RepID=U5D346_AMBTC|nr:uncharacterized protein At4g06744 [Amborella trichopoda]ERN16655.1 hypothetical protein AMTR_s00051p00142580 [Amborella trichopoda]|eukprot:XP_006855188.1 uncharacterized protein At4g06744 [Amborella trichopoda]